MPAFGNVVINDGQSTPAPQTFSPVKIDGDVATWANRAGGVPSGYATLSASNRDPGNGSQVNRERFTLSVPVVADGSDPSVPAGTVLRTLSADCTVLIPVSSTLDERKDLLAYLQNFLASSDVESMVQDLEHVY